MGHVAHVNTTRTKKKKGNFRATQVNEAHQICRTHENEACHICEWVTSHM